MKAKKTIGLVCLMIGGLAWPIGFALHLSASQILPVHLFFIFSGLALRGSHLFALLKRRFSSPSP